MKINCYVKDNIKFTFVNIISIIVLIKILLFNFILKLFVSIIIFKIDNIIYYSFVSF